MCDILVSNFAFGVCGIDYICIEQKSGTWEAAYLNTI